jgi:predicted nucleic acid-binding Zn ribbon protein
MFTLLLSKLRRHCPVCGVAIEGEGVRRGLRVFCSSAHLEKFVSDDEARKRALRRMSDDKDGCCG